MKTRRESLTCIKMRREEMRRDVKATDKIRT